MISKSCELVGTIDMPKPVTAYLAGPIFTIRDRMFNDFLAKAILEVWPNLDLYVPQNNASINDKTKSATSIDIYRGDMERLAKTDVLIATISGDVPPIGTTCEIGIFTEMMKHNPNKYLIVLYDDSREASVTYSEEKVQAMRQGTAESQFPYCNLFLVGCIKDNGFLVKNVEELTQGLREIKSKFLQTITGTASSVKTSD